MKKIFLKMLVMIVLVAILVIVMSEFGKQRVEIQTPENQMESLKKTEPQELDLQSEEVKNIIKKFNFEDSTVASIYKTGDFDVTSMPNDLILRMAWNYLNAGKERNLEIGEERSIQIVAQEEMESSVKSLFGNDLMYKNESFENIDSRTFAGYNLNQGTIVYENSLYTANYCEGGGGSVPYIYEVAQKALKYGNTIDLYVKTAFVDTTYDEEADDFQNHFYANFDFENEVFDGKIRTGYEADLYENVEPYWNAPTKIQLTNSLPFDEMKQNFPTYVYRFKVDDTTNESYFTGFHLAKEEM